MISFPHLEVPPFDDPRREDVRVAAVARGAKELAKVVAEAEGFHVLHFHPHGAAGAAEVLPTHGGKKSERGKLHRNVLKPSTKGATGTLYLDRVFVLCTLFEAPRRKPIKQ